MKVAVLEYLSGAPRRSGCPQPDISPRCGCPQPENSPRNIELLAPLYQEGLSMLSALATDLSECGHEVHTCMERKAAADPLVVSLFKRFSGLQVHNVEFAWLDRWIEVALQCDRTIVIAPEIHQQLERIVNKLRLAGAVVIASTASFLQATSDKLATAELLKESGVPHPETQSLTQYLLSTTPQGDCNARLPLTLKPHVGPAVLSRTLHDCSASLQVTLKRRDGAGCADMKVFEDQRKLIEWLKSHESQLLAGDDWIVQPWHSGRPASLALIAVDDRWTVLGAVEQRIELTSESIERGYSTVSYLGGAGPLAGVSIEQLERLALSVREALPSRAEGWIGIDFLIPDLMHTSQDLVVIEINPRLTTSYLGYRKWYGHTLADALLGNAKRSELHPTSTSELFAFSSWTA